MKYPTHRQVHIHINKFKYQDNVSPSYKICFCNAAFDLFSTQTNYLKHLMLGGKSLSPYYINITSHLDLQYLEKI